jgi:RNA-binding protein
MNSLSSADRKFLRSRAHHLEPIVYIGKNGVTDQVIDSADKALTAHELIKVRFVDRKDEKKTLVADMAERTGCEVAGIIGHVAILYREHPDAEKRRIKLPEA